MRSVVAYYITSCIAFRAHFRFCGCKNRDDSHGRRLQHLGNEEALLDSTANRGPIQGEPNTRGHGSFRRLLSSIISPVRGRPRVVSPRGGLFFHINSARPRARLRPFFVSFLFSRLSYNPGFVLPASSDRFMVSDVYFDRSVSGLAFLWKENR